MKKSITILGAVLFASLLVTSCGGNSAAETATEAPAVTTEASEAATEETAAIATEETETTATEEKSTESKGDCDQFIKDYEEFVNDYIALAKKMKANPTDMTIMKEYSEMASKAATMQNDAAGCTDAKYTSKLTKLATKMATAAAGM